MPPKITIAIPTYNRPVGLKRSISSILAQNYQDFELLISDNASTDKDVSIVLDWATKLDSRISVFKQKKNIGPYENCWFLINQAKGEYFSFLADDDVLSSNYFNSIFCLGIPGGDFIYASNLRSLESRNSELDFNIQSAKEVSSNFNFFTGEQESRILAYVNSECPLFTHLIYCVTKREIMLKSFSIVRAWYRHAVFMDTLIVYCLLVMAKVCIVESTYRVFSCHPSNTGNMGKASLNFQVYDLWVRLIIILRINSKLAVRYFLPNFIVVFGLLYTPLYIYGKWFKSLFGKLRSFVLPIGEFKKKG